MAEWKIKKEKAEKTEDKSMELEGEEEAKDEDEEPEEKEDIETEEAEEQEELSEEESKNAEEELSGEAEENGEEDEEKKQVFVHEVGDFGSRGSLESEVEETGAEEGSNRGFEGFTSQMSVKEIPASTLISSPATGGIEEEVGGITEISSSRERREQAARTPVADYTAGAYERNYWVGGEGTRRETRDMEMSIMPIRPEKEIREAVDIGRDARRIDFSAWQRGMEAQDMRVRREAAPKEEEYVIDIRKASEETRLPFERKEKKREYRP